MKRLYAAGPRAVVIAEDGRMDLVLEDRGARCLAVDPADQDVLYVGTDDEGVLGSRDGGRNWDYLPGIEHPRVTAIAVSPVDGSVYAGTEPSTLFVTRDGGESWRELEGMKNLPSASTWSFPPRPWTSHVRAIALSHEDPGLILAGIELGGVLRSHDGGETWQDQRPGAQPDCHALATHPAASPRAGTSATRGRGRTTASGTATPGGWPWTPPTPSWSTSRPRRGRGGRTGAGRRMRRSTAAAGAAPGSRHWST